MIGGKEPFGLGSVTVLVGHIITNDKCNLCINLFMLLACGRAKRSENITADQ